MVMNIFKSNRETMPANLTKKSFNKRHDKPPDNQRVEWTPNNCATHPLRYVELPFHATNAQRLLSSAPYPVILPKT